MCIIELLPQQTFITKKKYIIKSNFNWKKCIRWLKGLDNRKCDIKFKIGFHFCGYRMKSTTDLGQRVTEKGKKIQKGKIGFVMRF